ncbi:MAG: cytochrome c oxidase subunit II [Rhodospirillaceae bacterium]
MLTRLLSLVPASAFGLFAAAGAAQAAEGYVARSAPWQIWFQKPMSPTAEAVYDLNVLLMWIEGAIVLFVLGLMAYIVIKFNRKSNPVPSKTTHNTLLEVLWTGVPILILIGIAIPSLKVLYFSDKTQDAEMTLKVIGNQWYWSYQYPDHGDLAFDSVMIPDDELKPGQPRLLAVDNPVVLPANTNIRLLYSSNDVIHNWAVPSLSLKMDNTPGRINETWTHINQPGDYYGMCSELCGVNHGFMPIHIKALSKEDFANWLVTAKQKFASKDAPKADAPLRLAAVKAAE